MAKQVTVTVKQTAERVEVTNGSSAWEFAYHGTDHTTRAAVATIAQAMLTSTIDVYLNKSDEITLKLTLEIE